jgi:hypothetical protein
MDADLYSCVPVKRTKLRQILQTAQLDAYFVQFGNLVAINHPFTLTLSIRLELGDAWSGPKQLYKPQHQRTGL